MKKIISGGTIITATETYKADILIEKGKISKIGYSFDEDEGIELVDASGMLVMPGGVDVHTHFDLPMFNTVSSDDHYTGHKAAAFGGTTTVIDFIPQDKPHLLDNVETWRKPRCSAQLKLLDEYGCRRPKGEATAHRLRTQAGWSGRFQISVFRFQRSMSSPDKRPAPRRGKLIPLSGFTRRHPLLRLPSRTAALLISH